MFCAGRQGAFRGLVGIFGMGVASDVIRNPKVESVGFDIGERFIVSNTVVADIVSWRLGVNYR